MPRTRKMHLPSVPTWTCPHCGHVHTPATLRRQGPARSSARRANGLSRRFRISKRKSSRSQRRSDLIHLVEAESDAAKEICVSSSEQQ
jgi:hypothetical protein